MDSYIPLELPGLVGDNPACFLAALALIEKPTTKTFLSWDAQTHHAIIHVYAERYTSVQDVVAQLVRTLSWVEPGWAIPGQIEFPLKRRRGGPDPLRMPPEELHRRRRDTDFGVAHWLDATLTDQDLDSDGNCGLTPYIALRGRQTIGSFWYYPMLEVRKDPERLLTEALISPRRVEGADGWMLDHHATYSTDPGLRGPGGSMAVPGTTWLATLALRRLPFHRRTTIDNKTVEPTLPVLWHRVKGQDVLVWPLWRVPVDSSDIQAMWNVAWGGADWRPSRRRDGTLKISIWPTHGLYAPDDMDQVVDVDIFTMCAAVRPPMDTPAGPIPGPLTPVPIITRHDLPTTLGRDDPPWEGDQHAAF